MVGEAWGDGVEFEWGAYVPDGFGADGAWAGAGGGAEGLSERAAVRRGADEPHAAGAGDVLDCGVWVVRGAGRHAPEFLDRVPQVAAEPSGQLARKSDVAQAVRAIGRDLDIDHGVSRGKNRIDRGT